MDVKQLLAADGTQLWTEVFTDPITRTLNVDFTIKFHRAAPIQNDDVAGALAQMMAHWTEDAPPPPGPPPPVEHRDTFKIEEVEMWPDTLRPGEVHTVRMTVRNTGTETWNVPGTDNKGYFLGPRDENGVADMDIFRSNPAHFGRIKPLQPVSPGTTATFEFSLTGPAEIAHGGVISVRYGIVKDPAYWLEGELKTLTVKMAPALVSSSVEPSSGMGPLSNQGGMP